MTELFREITTFINQILRLIFPGFYTGGMSRGINPLIMNDPLLIFMFCLICIFPIIHIFRRLIKNI